MTTLVQEWIYSDKTITQIADEFGFSYMKARNFINEALKMGLDKYIPNETTVRKDSGGFRLSMSEQLIFNLNIKDSYKSLLLQHGTEPAVGLSKRRCAWCDYNSTRASE